MPTYDFTKGGGSAIPALYFGKMFVARIPIVVADIIAADAVTKAAGKIAAGDIIQLWDVPAKTVLMVSMASLRIVSTGTAGNTVDVGIAGGDEIFDGVANVASAGTIYATAHGADWGTDNYGLYDFESTDTIDIKFVADETIGEMVLYIPGYYLD